MRRAVDHGAMPIAGFVMPWSVRAGERADAHVSSSVPIRDVRIVRLDTAARESCPWPVEALEGGLAQREIERGSYLAIAPDGADELVGLSLEARLTREDGARTLLRVGELRLALDGRALRVLPDAEGMRPIVLPIATWIAIRIGGGADGTTLRVTSLDPWTPLDETRRWSGRPALGRVLIGTGDPRTEPSLNARFARPVLETARGTYRWSLPTRFPDGPLLSRGPEPPLALEAFNLPTFCVASARWDGSSFDPRLVPDHYDAAHCHDDDVGALDWPVTYRAGVPADALSGVYAFELAGLGCTERLPFFVRAASPRASLVFLAPTATYLAYADEYLPAHLYPWTGDDRGHRFAQANELRSLYDYHRDLSGVTLCSVRRPRATVRDDYVYPLCGCPHNLPVDLRLLRFCRERGIDFDLVTDHDLHADERTLDPYRAVMSGSHPEYLSVEMERRLREFAARGGSIAYLGGNGFAGVVALRGELMELRRSSTEALRTWDGALGEQHLALTNEPGGHLRSRGRGEFSLTGVAISLMGFGPARPFARTPASRDPACAWLFEGVAGERFGDAGEVLGGAAGYEVDATDPRLGTSSDTMVVARADGFDETFLADPARWYEGGEAARAERRCAEMTCRYLPSGALVFSASSVAWCGALPPPGETNDVGRITSNLLTRISMSAPVAGDAGGVGDERTGES